MKNPDKSRTSHESFKVSEAARILRVSVPTAKRMFEEGRLQGFHTPGGQLRITAESIEALRDNSGRPRPVRDASPVLQNRRERLEELTLEAQELRAKRELEKLRQEESDEEAERLAEAEEREREAAERREALALERERMAREGERERQREEAEQHLAAFRSYWLEQANELLAASELRWLSLAQRKEVMDALEAEIMKRQPQDSPRMAIVLARATAACIEPMMLERDATRAKEHQIDLAVWRLPAFATDAEKAEAAAVAREALARLPYSARDLELRSTTEKAIEPVRRKVARRLMTERVLNWAVLQLPWPSTEQEKVRLRRECREILEGLPEDITEVEAKEALETTICEARQEIEGRQATKEREQRKANLIQQGAAEVTSYLAELHHKGEITTEEYWDSEFTADIQATVKKVFAGDLSGDETTREVKELVRETIDAELE